MKRSRSRTRQGPRNALVDTSPLRQVDPRIKLALSLCAYLAVMLPLERLVITMILYGIPDIRWLYENDVRFLKQFA